MDELADVIVAPSLLSADFGRLAEAVEEVKRATNWLHIDVMDGHFVPNLTVGPPVVESLRRYSDAYFDCHLMITNPHEYLEAFRGSGADSTTVHVEVGRTGALIDQMRSLELSVGVALSPETPFSAVEPFVEAIDMLLVMTVHPGFGGQVFMGEVIEKIRQARDFIDRHGLDCVIEVDGGIDPQTAPRCAAAGARIFVAGSAVFHQQSPEQAVREIEQAARLGLLSAPKAS